MIGREFLVNEEHAQKLFKIMAEKLQEHLKRSDERIAARTDEDYDEEVEEDLQNDDDEDSFVLQKIRFLRPKFGPIFLCENQFSQQL